MHRPVFYLKHNVSETGFCLRLQVIHTQLGLKDILMSQDRRHHLRDGDIIQSRKRYVLHKRWMMPTIIVTYFISVGCILLRYIIALSKYTCNRN
jgi:hypothetical protein